MADIPWTWLLIRGSGITAWALLTAVVAWGLLLRSRLLGSFAPPQRLMTMHRWLGATALAFLFVHLALLLVDPVVQFTVPQILVPGMAAWETLAVALGTLAMWASSFGMGHDRTADLVAGLAGSGPVAGQWGTRAIAFWTRGLLLLLAAFVWGYFWAIATAAYLLLRQDVDGTECDEVVLEEPVGGA